MSSICRRYISTYSLAETFDVTAGPALVQCMGYTASGLPLSMQPAGRPVDEETVLRIADAYERATPWRQRRPVLPPVGVRIDRTLSRNKFPQQIDREGR